MLAKKLSVIIPCYNAENIIERCLNSLVNQTLGLENMEIILVNDASTDGTLQILKAWEEKYPDSILLIDSTVNMKTGGARNLGIQHASGEYIGFVDNDDWVDETMYEKAYSAAKKHNCDVVGVLYARELENGYRFPFAMPKGKKNVPVDATKPIPDGVSPLPGEVWSKIYRKSLLVDNDLYFPEGLSYPENYWALLLKYYIKSYYVVDEILYHYIQYENSIIVSGNLDHILDRLEIQIRLLQEISKRGLADINDSNIKKNFLHLYYVNTLHLIFMREQSAIPYEICNQMKEEVLNIYPQYYEDNFVKQYCCKDNAFAFLLRTLEYKMTNDLWDKAAEVYPDETYDLSIFLHAEKEEKVQGTLENREVFKLGYLLFREMQSILSEFHQILYQEYLNAGKLNTSRVKAIWQHYEDMILQRVEEAGMIEDVVRENYHLEQKFYRLDGLERLWKESLSAFDRGETESSISILIKLQQFLVMSQDLYQGVWCRNELIDLSDDLEQ
ncbi:MAG: glycosyltransferase [Lachnospiraceae bacterium]|nr:glycosyltransferase [Lachnospiraceae bacterium]